MAFRIGVDVGGTFTDFLLLDGEGTATVYKVLSTPDDPSRAVLDGLAQMADDVGLDLGQFIADIDLIVHGTTVTTTNAVLTGKTSPTGLLTTRGFRDALQMRRGVREVQYDNKYPAAEPLVPRWLRRPVSERVDAQGAIVQSLDLADVDDAIVRFKGAGIDAVAICFMHGYANSNHEQAAADRVAELMPKAYLSVSSQVLPQVRFYERISTTVLNAAVGPILSRYLTNLTARLADQAFAGVLLIMKSNGGVTSPKVASDLAASTLLSGPAAAPVAGLAYATPHETGDFITIDMGGTSFDAALVKDGTPAITTDSRVNRHALGLASMEINTIGAGGGSIAWIDDGGLLRMGPDSATIAIPEGTFLNAGFPAATTFGNSLTGPTSDAIFSRAFPGSPRNRQCRLKPHDFVRHNRHRSAPRPALCRHFFLSSKGGSGAVAQADGYDHIGLINCAGGILAQDYEMFEIQDPHVLVRHEYWPDSAGAGEWRGGLGTECEIAINGESLTGVAFGDGVENEARAFGLFGGTAGVTNQLYLTEPDGSVRRPKAKEVVRDIATGSVFVQQAGGGGGYGDPRRRNVSRVVDDVRNELISVERARTDYGVVIDPQTFEVDAAATEQLRAKS